MLTRGFKSFPDYISEISDEKYLLLDSFTNLLDSVARITNQCIYLIDFYKGRLLYVSDNPLFLSGLTTQEVMAAGGTFNTQYVSEGENIMIVKIIKAWFRFLENIPTEEKLLYSIRYDYMLDKTLVNNVMTVAFLSEEGKPWLVTCTSKVSTNSGSGNVRIMKNNSSTIWNYSIINDKWTQDSMVVLTDIERAVLRLSIQGKREKEICDEIYRSIDGLKSIKKKIFYKMEVNNITEAVSFAITFGLI